MEDLMCAGHCIKKVTYFSLNPHDSSTSIPILQKRKTKVSTKSKVLFLWLQSIICKPLLQRNSAAATNDESEAVQYLGSLQSTLVDG